MAALLNIYYGKSAALILILSQPRGIKAAYIITDDRGQHEATASSKNLGSGQQITL